MTELFEKYVLGTLSEVEQRQLKELLKNPEAGRKFVAFIEEWSMTADISRQMAVLQRSHPKASARMLAPGPRRLWPWLAAMAAGIIITLAAMYAPSASNRKERPASPTTSVVQEKPKEEEPKRTVEIPRSEPPAPESAPRAPAPVPAPAPRAPEPPPKAPIQEKPEAPPPTQPEPPPPPSKPKETVVVVARLERIQGQVTVLDPAGPKPAKERMELFAAQGVSTTGKGSVAAIQCLDGTLLEFGAETIVQSLTPGDAQSGKKVFLSQGELTIEAAPQPKNQPMIFLTPHAEARVLGTRFTLSCSADATHVEVQTGQIRLTRLSDKRYIDVRAGYACVAAKGVNLALQPRNLLVDPGFEHEGLGWLWNRKNTELSVVATPVHSGFRALQSTLTANQSLKVVEQIVAASGGEGYTASAWVKTQGVDGESAQLNLIWRDAAGKEIRRDAVGRLKGTQDWTQLGGRYMAPPNAKTVNFYFYTDVDSDGATVWFDDFFFGKAR